MERDGVVTEASSDSDEVVGRAVWTAPESSAAAGRRFFARFKPWTNLTVDDVRGGPDGTPVVDLSDIGAWVWAAWKTYVLLWQPCPCIYRRIFSESY